MRRFDRGDEGIDRQLDSERLRAFHKALCDALVPGTGKPVSVQGELVLAFTLLRGPFLLYGMEDYYGDDSSDEFENTFLGEGTLFMLDTLIENRNAPLDDEDLAFFTDVRNVVEADWLVGRRIAELNHKSNESEASEVESKELRELEAAGGLAWEEVLNRADRCIANWCIANPHLVDREGRRVEDRGIREVKTIFEPPPPPPPPCPHCRGKGWLPPMDASQFPERCSCKAENRRPSATTAA